MSKSDMSHSRFTCEKLNSCSCFDQGLVNTCQYLANQHGEGKPIPIYVNVYDIYKNNKSLRFLGLGVYHSATELFGLDIAFGGHDDDGTGVYSSRPNTLPPPTRFFKQVKVGDAHMTPTEVAQIVFDLGKRWSGRRYHMVFNNCNDFTDMLVRALVDTPLPRWINRISRIGSAFASCYTPKFHDEESMPLRAHESTM